MTALNILHHPDPKLRLKARPLELIDDALQQLIDDMFETMYDAPGIGLAATQVNVQRRLMVVDVSDDHDQPLVFINPELLESSGSEVREEGCLSVPDVYESVERAEWIKVRFLDRHGNPSQMEAEGLLAVCIQHEIDHLDGKLFVDYLSRLKQMRIRKRLDKQAKNNL